MPTVPTTQVAQPVPPQLALERAAAPAAVAQPVTALEQRLGDRPRPEAGAVFAGAATPRSQEALPSVVGSASYERVYAYGPPPEAAPPQLQMQRAPPPGDFRGNRGA